jgi:PhnB protein
MIADVPDSMLFEPGSAISVSISGAADEAELLQGYWDALAEGATIVEELTQAPWGDSFGMLVDRFGIHWMVNVQGPQAA